MAADFASIMRAHEARRAVRQMRDSEMQDIADHFMPRKDMTVTAVPGQLRQRRITSGSPPVALQRSAALIVAYMVDPTRPFIKPNVERGLVAAGRSRDLDEESRDYLTGIEWDMFDRMMLPQSGFLTSASRVAIELLGFGTGVQWTGRKRGFGPRYQARPFRRCWIAENDEGEVDTLDYCWQIPAWQVLERWPEARKIARLNRLASRPETESELVEVMHVVTPRRGGTVGAVDTDKPFADLIVLPQDRAIVAEAGWDSFPYSVPRLNVEDGSPYGTGLAWHALPDAKLLNNIQAAVERGVDLRVDPPLWMPVGLLDGPVDRRSGAVNSYDQVGLGFQSLRDAVQKMDVGGDVNVGVEYMRFLTGNIEQAFFVDWMRLRENGNMTATEVQERRDLRLRAMSAIVPAIDRDWMGPVADRTLAAMVAEDQISPPPEALEGVEVDWDYAGPLAVAQMQGQGEAIARLLDQALKARELDPGSVAVVEVAEGLRSLAESWGVPPGALRSRAAVAEQRAAEAEASQRAQEAELTEQAARAARDGGQAVASLAQAPAGAPALAA
jgi:hypothetical protein